MWRRNRASLTLRSPGHSFWLRWWRGLYPPPEITALMMSIYGVLAVAGLSALVVPPISIAGEIGPFLTHVWAGFLLVGGALGVAATPRGFWWIERVAILSVGTASMMLLATTLYMHFTSAGNRVVTASAWLAVFLFLAIRYLRIRGFGLDPLRR